jgi:ATP-dependent DNA helicase RecG
MKLTISLPAKALSKAYLGKVLNGSREKFKVSKREDLDGFLREKISDALSPDQKTHRIRNLLQEMRREGTLNCEGHGSVAIWKLAKTASDHRS